MSKEKRIKLSEVQYAKAIEAIQKENAVRAHYERAIEESKNLFTLLCDFYNIEDTEEITLDNGDMVIKTKKE